MPIAAPLIALRHGDYYSTSFFFFASYVQVTQERHENSLLKPELEKLREENRVMRELIKKSLRSQGQLLRLENAKLKAEVCMRRHLANSTL